MSVLKKEFIDRMAENGGITKKAARQGVDLFFETLADYRIGRWCLQALASLR